MNETANVITTSFIELNDNHTFDGTTSLFTDSTARTVSPDDKDPFQNKAGDATVGYSSKEKKKDEIFSEVSSIRPDVGRGHSLRLQKDGIFSEASSIRPDVVPGPQGRSGNSIKRFLSSLDNRRFHISSSPAGAFFAFIKIPRLPRSSRDSSALRGATNGLTAEEKFDQERRRLWAELDQQLQERGLERGLMDREVALTYNKIGLLLLKEGRLEEAMELLNQRLEIEKKVFQCDDDPKMAETYYNIARVLQQQGKYDAAKQQYEKALGIFLKVYGLVHSATATAYHAIGTVLRDQGKYKEANLQFARALVVQLEALGPGHSLTVKTNLGIANVWRDQGMYEEAMGEYQAVLTTLGRNHPYAASTYHCMGILLRNRGKFIDAMDQCQKALGITLKTLGPNHTKTALLYQEIGEVLLHQGRHEEASHRFQQALAICRQNLGDNHPRVAMIYNSIAKDLVHSRGDQEAALDLLSKAAEIQLMNSREDHPDLAKIYITMADALKNQSKFRDAAKLYNKALAIRIKVFGKENRFVEEVFLKKFKLSSGRVPILGLVQNFELVRPDDNIARNDE
mmetsp:Transcript_34985/g.84691  ORF Transcript_34985/g.84691 Transcript_34985/m.84691 type:complete len:568 (+) Transcript_34985:92-1795(+)